jgi:hypothetical protein
MDRDLRRRGHPRHRRHRLLGSAASHGCVRMAARTDRPLRPRESATNPIGNGVHPPPAKLCTCAGDAVSVLRQAVARRAGHLRPGSGRPLRSRVDPASRERRRPAGRLGERNGKEPTRSVTGPAPLRRPSLGPRDLERASPASSRRSAPSRRSCRPAGDAARGPRPQPAGPSCRGSSATRRCRAPRRIPTRTPWRCDRAMLELAYSCGLRAEVVNLNSMLGLRGRAAPRRRQGRQDAPRADGRACTGSGRYLERGGGASSARGEDALLVSKSGRRLHPSDVRRRLQLGSGRPRSPGVSHTRCGIVRDAPAPGLG